MFGHHPCREYHRPMAVIEGFARDGKSLFACLLWPWFSITGCQTVTTSDTGNINFKVPPGSRLVLNKELIIPAGVIRAILQHGEAGCLRSLYLCGNEWRLRTNTR